MKPLSYKKNIFSLKSDVKKMATSTEHKIHEAKIASYFTKKGTLQGVPGKKAIEVDCFKIRPLRDLSEK